ncbi:hypothetical protein R1flu_010613 [Riccia fluitans]|uniref:Peptidase A2 domain-containing protein n=1 Tax=Riccia fluitans TaxID=41844 RepID=A0ABD1Z5G9_9MARC
MIVGNSEEPKGQCGGWRQLVNNLESSLKKDLEYLPEDLEYLPEDPLEVEQENWPEGQADTNTNEGPEVGGHLLDHGNYLPWVEVLVGSQKCRLLIDTRADVNVLDTRVAQKLGMTRTKIVNPLLVRFVQGSTNVTEKLMSVPMSIGGATRRHEFLVMNLGAGMDGILSWNWLHEAKAKLSVT